MSAGTSGTAWRLGRRPALDGLRGVAILIVLGCHMFALGSTDPDRLHPFSAVGVTLFFVLSGFLITSLVAEEHDRAGRVSLRAFYARRARRLLPALALVLLIVGVPAVAGGETTWRGLASIAFYYANFFHPGLFGQAWSLSIEEQFYLVWPVVLILTLRRPRLALKVAAVGSAAALVWTLLLPAVTGVDPYERTDAHAVSLLAGCVLALAARFGLPQIRVSWLTYGSLVGLGGFWMVGGWTPRGDSLVLVTATGVSAVALWSACGAPVRVLAAAPMRYLGSRSYGLYLWHFPVMALMLGPTGHAHVPERFLSLGVSFVLAEASWRLVEVKFMRRSIRSGHASNASQELIRGDALGAGSPR